MEDLKQQIINKSEELFMRYGIRSVTMDDITRELGISKKTLYQYIDNKDELIKEIFRKKMEEDKRMMETIQKGATDAIDEIMKMARHAIRKLRQFAPTTIFDLQKYYRSMWLEMQQVHQDFMYSIIRNNLERGVAQGIYRNNLNPDIIAKLYVAKTSSVVDDELFPMDRYNIGDLFKEYIFYHIHGIASPLGLKLLERHLPSEFEKND